MSLCRPLESNLKDEPTDPDDNVEYEHCCTTDQSPGSSFVRHEIGDEPDKDGTDDRADTSEERAEGASTAVEEVGGDGALVRVEIVAREEHWAERCVSEIYPQAGVGMLTREQAFSSL